MALISKTIANLINGVSQQPPAIRNPTQCELQENCLSDVTYGVTHRPHSEYIAKLDSLGPSPRIPYFHSIDRGAGSQYEVVVNYGSVKVFNRITGASVPVTASLGTYLDVTSPNTDIQCLTVGTKTYILNKTKVVTQTGITVRNMGDGALVFIKQGDYSTDYTVTISVTNTGTGITTGPTAITKTTSATVANDIKTTQIATDLNTAITAAAVAVGLFVDRSGSVLWIRPKTGYTFKIALEDSKGNTDTRLIRAQMQKFADLPAVAPANYQVQIVGDKSSAYDDYYVVFTSDDPSATFANGSWSETFNDGDNKAPSPDTMPLVLTDNEDGTFTCEAEDWAAREAGSTVTNPSPSFIGKTISGMFTFANRLGFLCDERVIMSEVGQFTNFYLTTVVTFLDSDPIDIKELNGFGKWLYALPLDERLVIFSDKGQAVIQGDGLLTPKSATLKAATRYSVSSTCPPTLLGDNIYFAANNGDYSRIYEYFIQGNVESFAASEITSHVPQYLPVGITRLCGDDSSKVLVAIGNSENGVNDWYDLWVYKYFWIGDQKVQSSWSRWMFPPGMMIVSATLLDGIVYFCSLDKAVGDLVYHKMDLDITKKDPLATAATKTFMDFRIDGTAISSSLLGTTRTFTLPFAIDPASQDLFKCYRQENQSGSPRVSWGVEVPLTFLTTTTVSIEDPDAEILDNVWFGFPYTSTFTLSEIHLKEDQNGSQVPTETGKLTLKKIELLFNHSLYFRVEVTPRDRDTRVYPVTPYVLGDPTPLEEVSSRSGKLSFPVNAENDKVSITVINDSVVQHRLQSAEWTGNYSILSRRT